MAKKIDQLIINSPYEEPREHWKYDRQRQTFERRKGRRPAGYVIADPNAKTFDDPGIEKKLPLVNAIRPRVNEWREANYPGVTGLTRKLLEYRHNREARNYPFFFCQLEAIETLIWLTEAPDAEKTSIEIQGDGGPFRRICTKLCTGGGKTTVMAMLIAWQVCNKAAYPRDTRFTKNIFIVAPGLTVRSRLQVLQNGGAENNYYDEFMIVPSSLKDKLRQGKIIINNWQALAYDDAQTIGKRRGVDKRGPKSGEAYAREVLGAGVCEYFRHTV